MADADGKLHKERFIALMSTTKAAHHAFKQKEAFSFVGTAALVGDVLASKSLDSWQLSTTALATTRGYACAIFSVQ